MGKVTSIVVEDMEHCLVCGSPYIQVHHCMHGTANRKMADKYKLVVPLCLAHHTGQQGVHKNSEFDLVIKQMAQAEFEKRYSREKWLEVFNKSYL